MEMQIQIKVEANGVARYYLGLARGMVLQDIDIIYIHKSYFAFPPQKASKQASLSPPHLSLSTRLHQEEEGRRKFFFNFSSS